MRDLQIEPLLRTYAPQALGAVMRRYRNFAAAEDAVQEAMLDASLRWPQAGIPDNPRGWLIQVAMRRMTDQFRRDTARRKREALVVPEPYAPEECTQDDTLALFCMCCHPALSRCSAIALTLRAVGGLTTREIAAAFLVPEATMAQRISRAKQSIASSGVPFEMPTGEELSERLRSVLHVLYLAFSEGYASSSGTDLQRVELAAEAIRLARCVYELLPRDGEAGGLLALMLLTDARRPARSGPAGELIPLPDQDRSLWNREQIREGVAVLTRALSSGSVGYYQIQAAIAAVHDEAAEHQRTDWPQILALYELLKRISSNPMVILNHAVAAAMVHGPARGFELLVALDSDPRLAGHYRLKAVRAHLLEMMGERSEAAKQYGLAAQGTTSLPEREYLMRRAARIQG